MSIYVYAPDADDFDCLGLVGALTPTKCEHEEQAGGMSELTLEHPLDELGRYKALEPGCILKAPVPVRTTPEIQGGQIVTTVERWSVKVTATKTERYLHTKAKGGKKKKNVPGGTRVTVVARGDERYKCKTSKFGTGWIAIAALENKVSETIPSDPGAIELAEPAWNVQEQPFRIYEVEKTDQGLTVRARHLSYDLLGNLTSYTADNPTLGEALEGILGNCAAEHEFEAYTNIADRRVDVRYERENPVKALMDPEAGALGRWRCELVRDYPALYFLDRAGLNRGVRIEYSKNMLGVSCQTSFENVATQVLPVGENKDGEKIYLSSDHDKPSTKITDASYVKSPLLGSYPFPCILALDVSDAKVDSKRGGANVTPALACERLREAALAQFKNGADYPEISIKVTFQKLGDTMEYEHYKGLDDVFLYDSVKVLHLDLGIEVSLDVVRVRFDCLREKCLEIELGMLRDTLAGMTMATWQIPNGISGGKISPMSLGTGAFENEVVSARLIQAYAIQAYHIQSDTIETRHLQADSVKARAIQAEAITADKIAVNGLIAQHIVAQIAEIIQANVLKADIGEAHIDWAGIVDLRAIYAQIASAEIGKADIDFAQIKDLVSGRAIINQGVGGRLYISELAVTEANMVSLTTGELVIKGGDGQFYAITVDGETGEIVPVLKRVTGENVADRTLHAGEKIIEGTITAELLNVKQIFASEALIGAITAGNIRAHTITPAHVTSDFGATLDLTSNQAIRSVVNTDTVRQMIRDSTRELRVRYDGAGTHLTREGDATTMTAAVFDGGADVTRDIPEAAFLWTRESGVAGADAAWNAAHVGMRQVRIGKADVVNRSIISCTLLSAGDLALRFAVDPDTLELIVTEPPHGADSASYNPLTGMLTIDGEGYSYDQPSQTITAQNGLSATRTVAQFTFSDETGIRTQILQLHDRIRLIVEDDQGASTELRLTPNMIAAMSRDINLRGRVEIGDLSPGALARLNEIEEQAGQARQGADEAAGQMNQLQQLIQQADGKAQNALTQAGAAQSAAGSAGSAANDVRQKLIQLCIDSNMTYINGANIYTGSITADKINASNLYAYRLRDPLVATNSWIALQTTPNDNGGAALFGLSFNANGANNGALVAGGFGDGSAVRLGAEAGGFYGSAGLEILATQTPHTPILSSSGYPSRRRFTFRVAPAMSKTPDDPAKGPALEIYNNTSSGNQGIYVDGNIRYTGTSSQSSDRRVKRDVEPLNALAVLERLRAVRYRMIGGDGKLRFGLIYQEVAEALAALGLERAALLDDENPERLALAYLELIAPLIEGYQHLKRRLDAIEQRLGGV